MVVPGVTDIEVGLKVKLATVMVFGPGEDEPQAQASVTKASARIRKTRVGSRGSLPFVSQ
jgi:hypothetical protein